MTSQLTVPGLVEAAISAEPTRPVLTFYDDATGERTELSGATLANWIAKTANLLVDGYGLGAAGDMAVVRLPPHWQSVVVLLGCWAAGLSINLAGTPPEVPGSIVAFLAPDRLEEDVPGAVEIFGLALNPFATPMRPAPPPGVLDYVVEVRGYGDHFSPSIPVRPDSIALAAAPDAGAAATPDAGAGAGAGAGAMVHGGAVTHAALSGLAAERAAAAGLTGHAHVGSHPQIRGGLGEGGLRPGGRVLIDADAYPDIIDWLLAPLAAGASIVLCRHLDTTRLDARLAAERATRFAIS